MLDCLDRRGCRPKATGTRPSLECWIAWTDEDVDDDGLRATGIRPSLGCWIACTVEDIDCDGLGRTVSVEKKVHERIHQRSGCEPSWQFPRDVLVLHGSHGEDHADASEAGVGHDD